MARRNLQLQCTEAETCWCLYCTALYSPGSQKGTGESGTCWPGLAFSDCCFVAEGSTNSSKWPSGLWEGSHKAMTPASVSTQAEHTWKWVCAVCLQSRHAGASRKWKGNSIKSSKVPKFLKTFQMELTRTLFPLNIPERNFTYYLCTPKLS